MILICTHDPDRRQAWRAAIAGTGEDAVVAGSCPEVRRHLEEAPEAVLLLDLDLPNLHDGDGVEALLARHHGARILALSPRCTDAEGERLVHIGVQGYASSGASGSVIAQAVARIRDGGMWLSRRLMEYVIRHYRQIESARGRDELAVLTPRQQEVVRMVARGLPNKRIARELGISERTVKAHLSATFERTAARTRTELVARFAPRMSGKARESAG